MGRSDISFDATVDKTGIGLKTFVAKSKTGNTLQKIAEFNSHSSEFRQLEQSIKNTNLSPDAREQAKKDLVKSISHHRNKRLDLAWNVSDVTAMLYHIVTRDVGKMRISEFEMKPIDLKSITSINYSEKNILTFKDNSYEYSFNISKSTLYKRFNLEKNLVYEFDVSILNDPYSYLTSHNHTLKILATKDTKNYILLPLYSDKYKEVCPSSGLNVWRAKGRARTPDEAYIPSWIHRKFPGFFTYSSGMNENSDFPSPSINTSPPFNLLLPNGNKLESRIKQDRGKALGSIIEKELGKWLFDKVFEYSDRAPITRKLLKEIGTDTVKLTKLDEELYAIDFMHYGAFEEFKRNIFNK